MGRQPYLIFRAIALFAPTFWAHVTARRGPTSIHPATSAAYGPDFPVVRIRDIVKTQSLLLDALAIERLRTVIGASIGGMQALQWAIDYPDRVGHCIAIGTAPLSAMGLALNHLQRRAILLDPNSKTGIIPRGEQPEKGLALARAIAMCSYKSAELFGERYGAQSEPQWRRSPPLAARAFRCCRIS